MKRNDAEGFPAAAAAEETADEDAAAPLLLDERRHRAALVPPPPLLVLQLLLSRKTNNVNALPQGNVLQCKGLQEKSLDQKGLKYLALSVSRPRGGLGVERDGAERGGDFVERRGQPVVGHHLRDGGPHRGVE